MSDGIGQGRDYTTRVERTGANKRTGDKKEASPDHKSAINPRDAFLFLPKESYKYNEVTISVTILRGVSDRGHSSALLVILYVIRWICFYIYLRKSRNRRMKNALKRGWRHFGDSSWFHFQSGKVTIISRVEGLNSGSVGLGRHRRSPLKLIILASYFLIDWIFFTFIFRAVFSFLLLPSILSFALFIYFICDYNFFSLFLSLSLSLSPLVLRSFYLIH